MKLETTRAGILKKMDTGYECFLPNKLNEVRFNGRYEEWIKFFLRGICDITKNAISSIKEIASLRKKDTQKIMELKNINTSNLILIYEYILKHPFLISEDIKEILNLSKPTINKLIDILVELKILYFVGNKNRYKQYVYKEYVDILVEGTEI